MINNLRASVDIGSNSIILLIAKITDQSLEEVENIINVTALGKNLDKLGHFDIESKKNSFKAFEDYYKKVLDYGIEPESVILTATEASRVASDAKSFFEEIKRKFRFNVQVISSEGEAYYTSLGVSLGSRSSRNSKQVIIDIGGASTELIEVDSNPYALKRSISLPIGSVRASDFLNNQVYSEKMIEISTKFEIEKYSSEKVICVAGNMTTLACMLLKMKKYSEEIHGKTFELSEIEDIYKKIKKLSSTQILNEYSFIGKRAESIVGGTKVILSLAKLMKIEVIEISTYGLRHGTLFEGEIDERFRQ